MLGLVSMWTLVAVCCRLACGLYSSLVRGPCTDQVGIYEARFKIKYSSCSLSYQNCSCSVLAMDLSVIYRPHIPFLESIVAIPEAPSQDSLVHVLLHG